jgi:hydrophobe/amphiphile efflux-1 (HAE1) family protein
MGLADVSIRRPVFAWMLMIALIVFGGVSWMFGLGVSQFPDVDLPTVSVQLTLPGAAPEVMESDVVDEVESALIQVEGITSMSSSCREGNARVTLEFELDRDIDAAVQEVQTRIAQVQRRLPRDMDPIIVSKQNPEDQPIMWIGVSGTRPIQEISDYVRNVLKDQFQTIPGVGEISMGGFRERNVRIWLNGTLLQSYNLTVDEVTAALSREHIELPSGRIETSSREFNIRTEGEAANIPDFRDLVISERDGATIKLRDVAIVEDGLEDKRRVARVNGMPAMGMGIRKLRGANAVEVARQVRAKIAEIRNNLPDGIEVAINMDSTTFIEDSTHELMIAVGLAVILTAFVCWLFLGSVSSTINVLLAIPTSLIGTLAVMYFMGFTVNTFTLLALSLAVGIVVDDAIMVMENIYRHAEMGKDRVTASGDGAREITFAAIVATAAIIAIFLPLAFMQGIIGKFLYQFGVVLSVAVAFSLLEALTITPARTSQMLNVSARRGALSRLMERAFHSLAALYSRLLRPTLKLRYLVIVAALGITALSYFPLMKLWNTREMIPPQDQSRFMIRMQTPVGSSIDFTDAKVTEAEKFLLNRPEVNRIFGAVGGFGGGEVDTAVMFVTMVPPQQRQQSQQQFMNTVRGALNSIPGVSAFPSDPSINLPGQRGSNFAVNFFISGPNWDILTQKTREIMEKMKHSGVYADVDSDYRLGAPEVRIKPDRRKATDLGVSMEAIGRTVNALVGGVRIVKFKDQGRRYDVRVRLMADQRRRPEDIEKLYVKSKTGELISLADVVNVTIEPTLLSITREDRSRAIRINCNPAPGKSPNEAEQEALRIARETLPGGYNVEFTGASKSAKETFTSLIVCMLLGIVVAYMILAAQFNSFLHPLTVLTALPFSLVGAIFALASVGYTINMFSMIGIVLLMGIVKKNSILLVDFTNQRREQGRPVRDALLEACPTRLRPILMTTVSTIVAAIPAAIALDMTRFGLAGGGQELRAPMAVAVIGGVIVSTLLTLFVVPALYAIFEDFKKLLGIGQRPAFQATQPVMPTIESAARQAQDEPDHPTV